MAKQHGLALGLVLVCMVAWVGLAAADTAWAAPLAQGAGTRTASPDATRTPTATGTVTPTRLSSPTVTPTQTISASGVISPTPALDAELAERINTAMAKTRALKNYYGTIQYLVGSSMVEYWIGAIDGQDLSLVHYSGQFRENLELIRKDNTFYGRELRNGNYTLWQRIPDDKVRQDLLYDPLDLIAQMVVAPGYLRKITSLYVDGQDCDLYTHDLAPQITPMLADVSKELGLPLTDETTGGFDSVQVSLLLCPDGYIRATGIDFVPEDNFGTGFLVVTLASPNNVPSIEAPAIVTPTPTLSPTPLVTPTPTIPPVQATATVTAATQKLEAAQNWQVAHTGWHENNFDDWPVFSRSGEGYQYTISIADNTYRFKEELDDEDGLILRSGIRANEPAVFYAQADVRRVEGAPDEGYGLAFELGGDSYYTFFITEEIPIGNGSTFSVDRTEGDHIDYLISYEDTDAVHQGGVNRLGLLVEGKTITLFINDQYVATVRDERLQPGGIGMYSQLLDPGSAVFEFSNFSLRVPPSAVTPTPSAVDQAKQAAAGEQARQAALKWDVVAKDDFSNNSNQWPLDDTSPRWGPVKGAVVDGKYRWEMELSQPEWFYQVSTALPAVGDFYATVDGAQLSGPSQHEYGIIFRATDGDFYTFTIRNDGYATVESSGRLTEELVREFAVPFIKPGAANKLGVLARGAEMDFFINDQWVAHTTDETYKQGRVGIWFGQGQPGAAVLEYDNLELRAPK